MPLESGALLALLLLGGFVAIDGTSFGQFMVSRPVVAAVLAGWIVGAPLSGLAVGVILESFHLSVLPVGAAKYPEGGPPAVAAGAVYGLLGPDPVTLLLTVLGALLLEWLGGESVRILRQTNVRLLESASGLRAARELERRHIAAIAVDFLRGMLLVAFGGATLALLAGELARFWGIDVQFANIALLAAVVAMLASAFKMLGGRLWFAAAGAALGGLVLLLSA